MFHRKGPWFYLVDLYVSYYAPKSSSAQDEQDDVHVEESVDNATVERVIAK